jgi:predicted nucleotidyltransferase
MWKITKFEHMKNEQIILMQIKKTVLEIEPNSEIILYGSRARGDEREDSDWDLLILVPYHAGLKEEQKFRHKLFDVELQYGQAISTLVKSKKDWEGKFRITPLYHNIMHEGVTI